MAKLAEEEWQKAHRDRVATFPAAIRHAHLHCTKNGPEIQKSDACGCFYCMNIFAPSGITDWIEEKAAGNEIDLVDDPKTNSTAMCPRCGIDSVIGSASGFPITEEFLREMHSYWF